LQLFVCWWLANNPTAAGSVIIASHTQALADRASIRIRSLIVEHGVALGLKLSDTTTAAERWMLESGAEVRSVGMGTSVTGTRCSLIVLDDIVKGIEQAMSPSEKQKTYDWYRADLCTRLVPSGRIASAQTRWATDDLLGRLLEEEPERWTLLSLPAYAEVNDPLGREVGEPLWRDDPAYNYPAFIAEQKRALPPRMFVSLFQQSPIEEGGNLIKRDWIKNALVPPDLKTCHCYIGFDLATSEGRGDYSAIVTIAVDSNGDYHVVDVWRRRVTIDKTIDALLDRCRDYNPQFLCTEAGGLQNAAGPFLRSRMIERKIYQHIELVPARHSKEIRAQSFIGRAAVKGIYLPPLSHRADWIPDFVAELIAFPSASKNDDQVDAVAVVFQALDKIAPGSAPTPKAQRKVLSTDPALCTVSLDDMFEARERAERSKRISRRI
jgi:predicted phage terminase large subunit-like protein